MRRALPAEEAFAYVAGEDPRPLLVLRECRECNGTDRALLSDSTDNERTLLLARWFRCVKLPMDVREEEHPFHALFPTPDAEHLFVATRDGALRIPLESETSRVELWKAMTKVLEAEYAKRPEAALKKLSKILDRLDVLDERRIALLDRHDELFEKEGQSSTKVAKVLAEIAEVQAQVDELGRELQKASDLELLRSAPATPVGAAGGAPGG